MTECFEVPGRGSPDFRAAPFANQARTHVLIVDDDHAARRLCAGYCDLFDFTCASARTAAEAAFVMRRQHFDVALINVHMAGGGLEHLRALPYPGLPIIGLMALGRDDEAQRWRAAGLSAVIAKPITAAKLFAAITDAA